MDDPRTRRRAALLPSYLLLFALAALSLPGCLTPQKHTQPKETAELRHAVQDFHMKLRWGLWEQAAAYTFEGYRNEFMGRYEELGDDYKITNIEIKKVELEPEIAVVEVEQEWYHEPNMTVQDDRFMEMWVLVVGVWRLKERITKREFRARKEAAAEQTKSSQPPDTHTGEPDR